MKTYLDLNEIVFGPFSPIPIQSSIKKKINVIRIVYVQKKRINENEDLSGSEYNISN